MRIRTEKKSCLKVLPLILLIGVFTSCNPFKPEPRAFPTGELPKTYSLYSEGAVYSQRWWEEFNDAELNALMETALSENLTLKEAWARLKQSQAIAVQAGSDLYPELSVGAGAAGSRRRLENGSAQTISAESYSLGLISSYEVDLWGKIRSEREAALLEATATREDISTVAMTLAASVAETWTNIVSQGMQKRLLEKQLETNGVYLELVELRFRKGMVTALDVYQQKQVVERVKAEIPLVEAREKLFLHELSLLLGKPAMTKFDINRETLPIPEEIPNTGLPADLLASRPDIRSAGMRLYAADYEVAAARANRLPAINLSAEAGLDALKLDTVFNSWILSLAGNLTAPIFDGNRRAAEVDRTRAVVDENLSKYRLTVLTAIKEVEDALISEEKQRQHIKALRVQMESSRKALEQAGDHYRMGLNDYLPVLTQILAVQELERDLIQRQAELLIDRITLYRALGGSWMDTIQSG